MSTVTKTGAVAWIAATAVLGLAIAGSANAQSADDPATPEELSSVAGAINYWLMLCQLNSDLTPSAERLKQLQSATKVIDDRDGWGASDAYINGTLAPLYLAGPEKSCPFIVALLGPDGSLMRGWLELDPTRAEQLRRQMSDKVPKTHDPE